MIGVILLGLIALMQWGIVIARAVGLIPTTDWVFPMSNAVYCTALFLSMFYLIRK